MYGLVKYLIPFFERYSFSICIGLFLLWIIQNNSKWYIKHLELKAKRNFDKKFVNILLYNKQNPDHKLELQSNWLDLYKTYLSRRNNSLLLSLIFGYVSFNTTSYFESSDENFFKLLTISTTLFLAGITYIQQRYRE